MPLPDSLAQHPLVDHVYRPCVAMVVRNARDELLWCERLHHPGCYQFPQGGIEDGETAEQAMWRELGEELGLEAPREQLTVEARLDDPLCYDFTPTIIRRFIQRGWRTAIGQAQRYFLLRWTGDDSLITLCPPDGKPEFRSFTWDGPGLLSTAPPFKRDVIEAALRGFELVGEQTRCE